jgi:hypothetical protein
MKTTTEKNSATFTHLSALTQYFIPLKFYFSNTILDFKKDESEFVDYSGKQILNFQSLLLYTIGLSPSWFYFNHFNNVPVNAHYWQFHDWSFYLRQPRINHLGLTTVFFICLKAAEFF